MELRTLAEYKCTSSISEKHLPARMIVPNFHLHSATSSFTQVAKDNSLSKVMPNCLKKSPLPKHQVPMTCIDSLPLSMSLGLPLSSVLLTQIRVFHDMLVREVVLVRLVSIKIVCEYDPHETALPDRNRRIAAVHISQRRTPHGSLVSHTLQNHNPRFATNHYKYQVISSVA